VNNLIQSYATTVFPRMEAVVMLLVI